MFNRLIMDHFHNPVDFINNAVKDVSSLATVQSLYDTLKKEQKRLQEEVWYKFLLLQ